MISATVRRIAADILADDLEKDPAMTDPDTLALDAADRLEALYAIPLPHPTLPGGSSQRRARATVMILEVGWRLAARRVAGAWALAALALVVGILIGLISAGAAKAAGNAEDPSSPPATCVQTLDFVVGAFSPDALVVRTVCVRWCLIDAIGERSACYSESADVEDWRTGKGKDGRQAHP